LEKVNNRMIEPRLEIPTVVLVSAGGEWDAVLSFYQPTCRPSPYGNYFVTHLGEQPAVILHGGWGKIAAAASTQYAIQRWQPQQVINLGTCGGFADLVQHGEILLANRTLVYDIDEKMGDPQQALAYYTTSIDLSWLPEPYPQPVRLACLVSADRDLDPADIASLHARFGAIAADWESGAIAWVARRNNVRCLILRGVTDLVSPQGGEAYGSIEFFNQAALGVMDSLLEALPGWIERAGSKSAPKLA
jgi:adenosylhomocysteine nucleosidase